MNAHNSPPPWLVICITRLRFARNDSMTCGRITCRTFGRHHRLPIQSCRGYSILAHDISMEMYLRPYIKPYPEIIKDNQILRQKHIVIERYLMILHDDITNAIVMTYRSRTVKIRCLPESFNPYS